MRKFFDMHEPRTCTSSTQEPGYCGFVNLAPCCLTARWERPGPWGSGAVVYSGDQTVWCFASLPGLHQGLRRRLRLRRFTFDGYQKSYRDRKSWLVGEWWIHGKIQSFLSSSSNPQQQQQGNRRLQPHECPRHLSIFIKSWFALHTPTTTTIGGFEEADHPCIIHDVRSLLCKACPRTPN